MHLRPALRCESEGGATPPFILVLSALYPVTAPAQPHCKLYKLDQVIYLSLPQFLHV